MEIIGFIGLIVIAIYLSIISFSLLWCVTWLRPYEKAFMVFLLLIAAGLWWFAFTHIPYVSVVIGG